MLSRLRASLGDPDGRDTSYEIPPGNYEMVIYLNGVGVNEKFIFDLRNLGENENIILEPLQEIKATT
jgi:hypothetical protein